MKWMIALLSLATLAPLSAQTQDYAQVQRIESQPLRYEINRTGRIDFRHTIALSFKTNGYIEKLNVDEGYVISPGEILANLDTTDLESSLAAAIAEREKALADFNRGKRLIEQQSISAEEFQTFKTVYESAKSNVTLLEYDLKRAQIIAPFEAVVVTREANPGELHSAGEPIFIVASMQDNLVVRVDLTELEINKVQLGMTASLTLADGRELQGSIGNIAARANMETGLFSVEIDVQEKAHNVIAGQWATVSIALNNQSQVLALPINALAAIEDGKAIFIRQENGQYRRSKHAILHRDNQFLYLENRGASTNVVVAGWDRLLRERRVR